MSYDIVDYHGFRLSRNYMKNAVGEINPLRRNPVCGSLQLACKATRLATLQASVRENEKTTLYSQPIPCKSQPLTIKAAELSLLRLSK